MQMTQALRRTAQIYPNRTSTVFGERHRTWAETQNRVARLAGGLDVFGIKSDDRAVSVQRRHLDDRASISRWPASSDAAADRRCGC